MAHALSTDVRVLDFDYASSTSDVTYEVDTKGYSGCLFILKTAAVGGAGTIKAQEHDVTSTGQTDLTGTSITIATDDDDEAFYIDIVRPAKRFLSFVLGKGGATTAAAAVAILYHRSGEVPVTNTVTDEATGEVHVTPLAGTA